MRRQSAKPRTETHRSADKRNAERNAVSLTASGFSADWIDNSCLPVQVQPSDNTSRHAFRHSVAATSPSLHRRSLHPRSNNNSDTDNNKNTSNSDSNTDIDSSNSNICHRHVHKPNTPQYHDIIGDQAQQHSRRRTSHPTISASSVAEPSHRSIRARQRHALANAATGPTDSVSHRTDGNRNSHSNSNSSGINDDGQRDGKTAVPDDPPNIRIVDLEHAPSDFSDFPSVCISTAADFAKSKAGTDFLVAAVAGMNGSASANVPSVGNGIDSSSLLYSCLAFPSMVGSQNCQRSAGNSGDGNASPTVDHGMASREFGTEPGIAGPGHEQKNDEMSDGASVRQHEAGYVSLPHGTLEEFGQQAMDELHYRSVKTVDAYQSVHSEVQLQWRKIRSAVNGQCRYDEDENRRTSLLVGDMEDRVDPGRDESDGTGAGTTAADGVASALASSPTCIEDASAGVRQHSFGKDIERTVAADMTDESTASSGVARGRHGRVSFAEGTNDEGDVRARVVACGGSSPASDHCPRSRRNTCGNDCRDDRSAHGDIGMVRNNPDPPSQDSGYVLDAGEGRGLVPGTTENRGHRIVDVGHDPVREDGETSVRPDSADGRDGPVTGRRRAGCSRQPPATYLASAGSLPSERASPVGKGDQLSALLEEQLRLSQDLGRRNTTESQRRKDPLGHVECSSAKSTATTTGNELRREGPAGAKGVRVTPSSHLRTRCVRLGDPPDRHNLGSCFNSTCHSSEPRPKTDSAPGSCSGTPLGVERRPALPQPSSPRQQQPDPQQRLPHGRSRNRPVDAEGSRHAASDAGSHRLDPPAFAGPVEGRSPTKDPPHCDSNADAELPVAQAVLVVDGIDAVPVDPSAPHSGHGASVARKDESVGERAAPRDGGVALITVRTDCSSSQVTPGLRRAASHRNVTRGPLPQFPAVERRRFSSATVVRPPISLHSRVGASTVAVAVTDTAVATPPPDRPWSAPVSTKQRDFPHASTSVSSSNVTAGQQSTDIRSDPSRRAPERPAEPDSRQSLRLQRRRHPLDDTSPADSPRLLDPDTEDPLLRFSSCRTSETHSANRSESVGVRHPARTPLLITAAPGQLHCRSSGAEIPMTPSRSERGSQASAHLSAQSTDISQDTSIADSAAVASSTGNHDQESSIASQVRQEHIDRLRNRVDSVLQQLMRSSVAQQHTQPPNDTSCVHSLSAMPSLSQAESIDASGRLPWDDSTGMHLTAPSQDTLEIRNTTGGMDGSSAVSERAVLDDPRNQPRLRQSSDASMQSVSSGMHGTAMAVDQKHGQVALVDSVSTVESGSSDSTASRSEGPRTALAGTGSVVETTAKKWIVDPYGDQGEYEGSMLSGQALPHGNGTMCYTDGRVYAGEWKAGHWHGKGSALFSNGDVFEGQYHEDQRHGHGVYKWKDGRVYSGEFCMDQRQGRGQYKWPDGAKYEGEFYNGLRHGDGKYTFKDGSMYTGEWIKGKYHGFGKCHWADGRVYKGEWYHGKAHGQGIEIRPDGSIRHDGLWENDAPVRNRQNRKSGRDGYSRSAGSGGETGSSSSGKEDPNATATAAV